MKKGFTIVELLVIMGILGVIAALSIPTLARSNKKQLFANALATGVSTFDNACNALILKNNVVDLSEISANDFTNKLADVLNISSEYTDSNEDTYYVAPNGIAYNIQVGLGEAKDENAMIEAGGNLSRKYADIKMDVNGLSSPNVDGRDIFYFILGTDGILYPVGGKDWALYTSSSENYDSCEEGATNCAAYLMYNNYKMDY